MVVKNEEDARLQKITGRKLKPAATNSIRNSMTTVLRLKDEEITSELLARKQDLQSILRKRFSLNVKEVELPPYAQLRRAARASGASPPPQAKLAQP